MASSQAQTLSSRAIAARESHAAPKSSDATSSWYIDAKGNFLPASSPAEAWALAIRSILEQDNPPARDESKVRELLNLVHAEYGIRHDALVKNSIAENFVRIWGLGGGETFARLAGYLKYEA